MSSRSEKVKQRPFRSRPRRGRTPARLAQPAGALLAIRAGLGRCVGDELTARHRRPKRLHGPRWPSGQRTSPSHPPGRCSSPAASTSSTSRLSSAPHRSRAQRSLGCPPARSLRAQPQPRAASRTQATVCQPAPATTVKNIVERSKRGSPGPTRPDARSIMTWPEHRQRASPRHEPRR